MKSNIPRVAAVLALALALFAGAAGAQPNSAIGLWNVVAHDDTNPGMPIVGAQQVCILGNGTWYSPTYPGWAGVWYQKGFAGAPGLGNRVRLLGNWQPGAPFADAAELDVIHLTMMTGPWTEWRFAGYPPPAFPPPPPPGPPFSFLQVTACRLGGCGAAFPAPVVGGPPPLLIFGAGPMACNP
jgi:hypothetical protein